jgi:diaminohydroxyphosphoribosylaminopyrimidine deaminase/5-amino-6-(5-phosphoribosylamino)uracil reductase
MGHIEDIKFMKIAMKLGKKGTGFTSPNPLVGAVVAKNGKIIATGYHKHYGGSHAEYSALEKTNEENTTLYVTLEPCSHFGKTPPCTDSIINKKVKRVVIAMQDPNPLVNGKGIKKLEEKGIQVEVGLLEDLSKKINRHYLKFITKKLPYVTINAGTSIDGKLTDKYRESQWITDAQLRNLSHSLRGEFAAILVGVKTVADDDPQLTIREKEWGDRRIFRVILDSQNILDPGLRVFRDRERFPLILFSAKNAKNKERKVERHFFIAEDEDGLDLKQVLKILGSLSISSVLIEGGGKIIDSFLKQRLYDEIILFVGNKLIGGKESVELFPSGAALQRPVVLKRNEIVTLGSGYLLRGFRV